MTQSILSTLVRTSISEHLNREMESYLKAGIQITYIPKSQLLVVVRGKDQIRLGLAQRKSTMIGQSGFELNGKDRELVADLFDLLHWFNAYFEPTPSQMRNREPIDCVVDSNGSVTVKS